jgi:hypothetical protein
MKKIFLILAALLITSPAMAVVTFGVIQSDADPCQFYITYVNTEDSNVRAFALDIWVEDGNILAINDYNVGECIGDANCGYGIFMGTIVIDGTGTVTNDGSPIAEVADAPGDTLPGTPDDNGVTLEMGSLYELGVFPGPAQSGTLCTVVVDTLPTNLCIKTNFIRAGIVLENGDSSEDDGGPPFTDNLPLCEALSGGYACATCPGDVAPNFGTVDLNDLDVMVGSISLGYASTGGSYIITRDDTNVGVGGAWGNFWYECLRMDFADGNDCDLDDLDLLVGILSLEFAVNADYSCACGDWDSVFYPGGYPPGSP